MTELQKNKRFSKHQSHAAPLQCVPGIWVNGKYYWLPNRTEKVLYEEGLIIKMIKNQIHSKIDFYRIFVSNHSQQAINIKILALHYFQNVNQDCLTFVSPTDRKIFHHADEQVSLVNVTNSKSELMEYDYTTVPLWNVYTDQIWSSLKRGSLKYLPLVKGPAASILAAPMTVNPQKTERINTWTITGKKRNEVIAMEQALLKNSLAFPFEK